MVRSAVWWAYLPLATLVWALLHRDAVQRSRDWVKGTPGEQEVEELLTELESYGYQLVHHIKVRGGTVPHVAIGPAGVFVIETRSWWPLYVTLRHRLTNGNWETDRHIHEIWRAAGELTDRLRAVGSDQRAESILVLTRVTLPHGPIRLQRLTVLDTPTLMPFVLTRDDRLSPNQITMAVEAIRGGIPVATASTTSSQSQTEQQDPDTAGATHRESGQGAPSNRVRKSQGGRARSPAQSQKRRARV